jgi:hypothetical protein
MNPPIITQLGHVDPNAVPLTVNGLIDLFNPVLTSELQGSYIPYVIGSITPGSDDHDKAWIQTDSSGRPLAIKLWYNGNWRRIYNGMLGEVRGYHGDPSVDFDTDGRGKVGESYDGWHLCNGKDGTPDFSDTFIIGGHMNNAEGHSGYNNGWQTFVNGVGDLKTGGGKDITLTAGNTYRPARGAVTARNWDAASQAPNPHNGSLWGVKSNNTPGDNDNLLEADPGNTSPEPISILNPFVALGWIIFVGY